MGLKGYISIILSVMIFSTAVGQEEQEDIYNINLSVDLPIILTGGALTGYGFYKIGQKEDSDPEVIRRLDPQDINSFDRHATDYPYKRKWDATTDYFFYGSFPLPAVLFVDKRMRQDAYEISTMYIEALLIDGTAYTMTAAHIDRYRPYTYNEETEFSRRTQGSSKNSFLGGHPSITATSTFFIAKVYHDYYPESNWRYVLWPAASLVTFGATYTRYLGGYHFPSDLAVGLLVGITNGILTPELHKKGRKSNLSIMPYSGDSFGLAMRYKF